MKSNKFFIGLTVTAVFACSNAVAKGPNPYSDCGIGAALFKNDTGATISNVLWDIGSTAITSATASPDTCEDHDIEAAEFILESYDRLAEDTAKGVGTHLDTLLSIVNISATQKDQVVQSIRAEMATIVASDAYLTADKTEKATLYYNGFMKAISA